MPVYSARVTVPRRTGKTVDKLNPPWVLDEVMIDSIQASSQRKATKRALVQAQGFTDVQFPPDERDGLPTPSMVAVSRLKKDGKPVSATFDTKASVSIAGNATFGGERKTKAKQEVKKVVTLTPTMRVVLVDPFTTDIIDKALESNDASSWK